PLQTEVLNAKVGSTVQNSLTSTSMSKTQANLQKLDIDPQTKSTLSAMLMRQAQENKVNAIEKQAENTISDVLINGNALANKNNANSRILSNTETLETIAAKPIQNGNPSIGWTKFNDYIKDQ